MKYVKKKFINEGGRLISDILQLSNALNIDWYHAAKANFLLVTSY